MEAVNDEKDASDLDQDEDSNEEVDSSDEEASEGANEEGADPLPSSSNPASPQFETLATRPTGESADPPPDSDLSDLSPPRNLSRSPPRSRSFSPENASSSSDQELEHANNNVKDIVSSDLTKTRARQKRKYHSKKSTRRTGRAQGSKAKQDSRIAVNGRGGFWD